MESGLGCASCMTRAVSSSSAKTLSHRPREWPRVRDTGPADSFSPCCTPPPPSFVGCISLHAAMGTERSHNDRQRQLHPEVLTAALRSQPRPAVLRTAVPAGRLGEVAPAVRGGLRGDRRRCRGGTGQRGCSWPLTRLSFCCTLSITIDAPAKGRGGRS